MKVLRQLTWRYLKLNRKRTLVTIIGIILSAAMITGVFTLVASFQDFFIRVVHKTDGSHHATFYDVPYQNSQYIRDHAYTQEVMLSKDIGFARLKGSQNEEKPYLMIKAYDQEAMQHFPLTLKEGRLPEREGEIVLSEEVFYGAGVEFEIGDRLTLAIGQRTDQGKVLVREPLSPTEMLQVTKTGTFTVTGIIAKPVFETWDLPAYGAIAYLDESRLSPEEPVNVSIVTVNPKEIFEQVPKMAQTSGAKDYGYNTELLKWMGISQNERAMDMVWSVALIITFLIMVGSVAVIYNAFAISVNERVKQFGLLSSIGASQRQIRRMVLWEGVIVGFIGLSLGILAGIGGIGVTLEVINHVMDDSVFSTGVGLRLIISPFAILVSILLIALTVLLSVYLPARRASKVSPIEAIRQVREIQITPKTIKTSRLTRWLFGIEGELALKNLKRNKRRYRATLFSLFISIVLFISFSAFMHYGLTSSHIYNAVENHDFEVEKQDLKVDEVRHFYDQIGQLNGVDRYSVIRSLSTTAVGLQWEQLGSFVQRAIEEGETQDLFRTPEGDYRMTFVLVSVGEKEFAQYVRELGLDLADYTDPKVIRGILVNHRVLPGQAAYEPLRIKAGEKLELVEPSYEEEGKDLYRFTLEIGAVTEQTPLGMGVAVAGAIHGIDTAWVVVSEETFQRLYANLSEENKATVYPGRLYVKLKEGADREAFAEGVRALNARLYPGTEVLLLDAKALHEAQERVNIMISIFLYGFVSLITLIGITNIFNTISTNMALRRREFAMLRSVGLTPAGLNKMIRYESLFYGLKALLYGLPVGILVSIRMYLSIDDVFKFSFTLPWKAIVISIVGVFLIVFVTMLFSSAKLKKENIIDALKEENA